MKEPMIVVALRIGDRYQRARDLQETVKKIFGKNKSLSAIRIMIVQARKSGWQVRTTKRGYTLRPRNEDYLYELKIRTVNIIGTFQNGRPVFAKCKEINGPKYNKFVLESRPKLENLREVFHK